jgi:hypothetical protein
MSVKFNYATISAKNRLIKQGFEQDQAEAILLELSETTHENVYSKLEIDEMLSETVKNVFTEMRREFDKRMELSEKRFEDEIKEMRSHKRWIVGTIITVGIAIIGYLQFIH